MKETYMDTDKATQETLSDFLINRFQNNLVALKEFYPELYSRFKDYQPQKSMDFFCSESGTPNMFFSDEGIPLFEKYSSEIYKKFKIWALNNQLKQNIDEFANNYIDTADPKNFCSFLINNMKDELFNEVFKCNPDCNIDEYGQFHYKYVKAIAKLYMEHYKVEKYSIKDERTIPLFFGIGVGLGYQLEELYKEFDISSLIVIEPDADVFYASLHTFNWKKLLEKSKTENKDIFIIQDSSAKKIGEIFADYISSRQIYASEVCSGYSFYDMNVYSDVIEEIKKQSLLISLRYGFFDDRIFGTAHTIDAFIKKRHFVISGKNVSDDFAELPVFIIGSGPSLDNDLSFIRKNQDKAIIVACGSALDVLYHAGIQPDFFAVTERVPEIRQFLDTFPDKSFFENIILLSANVCHPLVTELFKHSALFNKDGEDVCNYITFNLKQNTIQSVQGMNPMVGNMGVSGILTLGFKKLYLFGLDCGKKLKNQSIHSELTTLYKKRGYSEDYSGYKTSFQIKANFGGMCESNNEFLKSVVIIGMMLRKFNEYHAVKCINCSDGALIDETEPMHSAELEELFSSLEPIDKSKLIKHIDNEITSDFNISKEDIKSKLYPQLFNRIALNVKEILEQKTDNRKDCLKVIQELNRYQIELGKQKELFFHQIIMASIVNQPLVFATAALFESLNTKECIETTYKIFDMIKDYLTEAEKVFSLLPDYIMGEHRKYYPDGLLGQDMPYCKAPYIPKPANIVKKEYDDPVKVFVKKYK